MPHDDPNGYAKPVVTPFGQMGWTQAGVTIKPFTKLRERFAVPADSSDLDLNPEEFAGQKFGKALRRRVYGR